MPDWKRIVRERVDFPDLKDLRAERIIEEIAGQLEDFYTEALADGSAPAEAERLAVERFNWEQFAGGVEAAEEPNRPSRSERWVRDVDDHLRLKGGRWLTLTDLMQDVRIALRQLRRRPGVSIAAVLCLAIAMAGGSFLYSMAVQTLLQSSPARNPEQVTRIYTAWEGSMDWGSVSVPDFEDIRDRVEAFSCAVLTTSMPMNLTNEGAGRRIWGSLVSAGYFRCLGREIVLGRDFLPEEDETEGTHPVMIISHAFWQSEFGGDPDVIGRQVQINRYPFTVIGVAEEGYQGDSVGLVMRFWVPVAMHEVAAPLLGGIDNRGDHNFRSIICRLAPGATLVQAQEQVAAVQQQLGEQYPDLFTGKSFNLLPERQASLDPMVRRDFQRFIVFGLAMIVFVLVLACANVAGLLLARTAGRRREIGIRMALGAGRGRLMRSLLIEGAVLAGLAGLGALLLAALLGQASGNISIPLDMPMEFGSGSALAWSDIGFIFVSSGLATILISLAPALFASREDITSALKTGLGLQPRRASFSRRALVAVQVAASFTLLVGGGMVLKGMQQMRSVNPGFDPEHQLVAQVDLLLNRYSEAEGRLFYRQIKERLMGLPEVESAGLAFTIPLSLSLVTHTIEIEGYEIPEGERIMVDVNTVDEDYFTTLGIPIVEGRPFTVFDTPDSRPVVIVNEAFRDRFWPEESPLGKRVLHGGNWHEIVGMVPTGKYLGLGEDPKSYMYYAYGQNYNGMMNVHIRTSTDPLLLADAVRREVAALDPSLPVNELNPMTGRIDFALMPFQIATVAMWTFALIAILLSSIGLYGLVAYFVNRQKREIGIRIALGAVKGNVLRHVIGRGMRLTIIGLGVGFVFALGAAVLASTAIPGLQPFDPVILGIPMVLLGVIAFVASLFPALLAARIAPAETLRSE